jgi:RNA polymerase sigma factor (sigma-70 family)
MPSAIFEKPAAPPENMADTTIKHTDDHVLVEGCLAGSEEAWAALQLKYNQAIYSVVSWPSWRFSQQDVEDLLADVYVKLINGGLEKFDFSSSLKNYLCVIAKNTCLDRVNSRRGGRYRFYSIEQDTYKGRAFADVLDSGIDVAETILKNETAQEIRDAFAKLKEECKNILKLRYREELSYDQIAKLLGYPIGTVGVLVSRCTNRLIDMIRQVLYPKGPSRPKKGI